MLLENFSENKEWVRPEYDEGKGELDLPRVALFPWFIQTNQYPVLMEGVDRGLEHEGWKSYPKTVLVHGDQDVDAPYQGALDAVGIIGRSCSLKSRN
ncbi:hypothetical protein B0O99DRAFT_636504 [Bisporella sp. PMI_857]|nr:hypothetical protein B0O99DRAFT_636504 [Bisporella sp. PMI_857]